MVKRYAFDREASGIGRRALLKSSALLAGLALTGIRTVSAATETVTVETKNGPLIGAKGPNVISFKGVPYGADTGGEGRFQPPRPAAPWKEPRRAFDVGSQFPQPPYPKAFIPEEGDDLDTSPMSEDSLFLNVWTPELGEARRPVMVWLHGGGFATGSGGSFRYDGSNLAAKHGVVLVTLNHRLNVFGYLDLSGIGGKAYAESGNAGMLDIVQALEWVRDNIAAFGGDPTNVTIFGQSGGGGKVMTLMAMPAAKGLFHRAIAMSGTAIKSISKEQAQGNAQALLKKLEIGVDNLDALQKVPAEKILEAMAGNFAPVVDGKVLPRDPFDPDASPISSDVPLITGWTLTERTFFEGPLSEIDDAELVSRVMKTAKSDEAVAKELVATYRTNWPKQPNRRIYQIIAADIGNGSNAITVAGRKSEQRTAPVYVYHFEKETPVRDLGAPHTIDIAYVFDNLELSKRINGKPTPEMQRLADMMSGAWTSFAKGGVPRADGLPDWAAYTSANPSIMVFSDTPELMTNPARYAAAAPPKNG